MIQVCLNYGSVNAPAHHVNVVLYFIAGERHLDKSSNTNKFERNQEDAFKVLAADLGPLKKVEKKNIYLFLFYVYGNTVPGVGIGIAILPVSIIHPSKLQSRSQL